MAYDPPIRDYDDFEVIDTLTIVDVHVGYVTRVYVRPNCDIGSLRRWVEAQLSIRPFEPMRIGGVWCNAIEFWEPEDAAHIMLLLDGA